MKNLNELLNESNDNAFIKKGQDRDIETWMRRHKPRVEISELAFDFMEGDQKVEKIINQYKEIKVNRVVGKNEFNENTKQLLEDVFNVNSEDVICFRYWEDDANEKICIAYATYVIR